MTSRQTVRFTKMHGIGNDYVYVNLFDETVKEPVSLARRVSDRHEVCARTWTGFGR